MPPKKRKLSTKKSGVDTLEKREVKTKLDVVVKKERKRQPTKPFITRKKVKEKPKVPTSTTRKQETDSPYEHYCIKQTLHSVLKLKKMKPVIEDMAQSVAVWRPDAYRLLALYMNRCLDAGRHVELGDKQTRGAFQLVTGKQSNFPQLNEAYRIYKKIFPPLPTPLERSGAVNQAVSYEITQFLTSAKTSMATHYQTRQTRWVKLQLYRYWLQEDSKEGFPKASDIYTYVKEITKASYLENDVEELKLTDNHTFNDYCVNVANQMRTYLREWEITAYKIAESTVKSDAIKDAVQAELTMTEDEKKKSKRNKHDRDKRAKKKEETQKKNQKSETKEEKKQETKEKSAKKIKTRKSLFPAYKSTISAEWTRYLPWMRVILKDISKWHTEVALHFSNDIKKQHKMLRGFKLFALCPRARVGISHITIDNRALHGMLKMIEYPGVPEKEEDFMLEKERWWDVTFKRPPSPKESDDSKRSPHVNTLKGRHPLCIAKTDGVSYSRCFHRPGILAPKKEYEQKKLPSAEAEIKFLRPPSTVIGTQKAAVIIGLDPGKCDIFSTSAGHGLRVKDRECTRMSNAEYRTLSGATKRNKCALKLQYRIAEETRIMYSEHVAKLEAMQSRDPPTKFSNNGRKKKKKKESRKKRKKTKRTRPGWRIQHRWQSLPRKDKDEKKRQCEEKEENTKKKKHLIVFTHKVTSADDLIKRHFFSTAYNYQLVWNLAKRKTDRRSRLEAYIRSNWAIDVACKRILDPWTNRMHELNKNKMSDTKQRIVIAFGQARFNGTKGCPSAPTKRLYTRLKNVHKDKCVMVDTNEFRTSQICNACGTQLTEVLDEESQLIYSLKACPTCFTVYDRDANAARNIAGICERMLFADGVLPPPLRRGQPALQELDGVPRKKYSSPQKHASSVVQSILWSTSTTW